ncbi:MAG TPA: MASE3 domain-containing protein, partial [Xanthomonadales bacterium]|nr:MASE3 domain-containing protein [Xanthomonadales bacterium]
MPNPPGGLQSLGAIAATEALPLGRAPWNGRGSSTAVRRPRWLHPRALAYLVVALALLAPLHLLQESAPGVRHVWFLVADALAVALAIVIGFISLAYYSGFRGRSLLYVSAGFLGAGLIELVHVLNILGLDVSLSPAIFTISEDWSSMAARLYLAIMLLAGWRASEGRISPVSTFGLPDRWIFALCSFLLMIFVTVCIYLPRAATLHGHGPAVSIAEVAIGVLYLVVLLIFLRRGDWRSYPFQHWFVLSLILSTISQLIYVPLSLDAADPVLLASHAIRLGSYALAFTALLSSTSNLFRQASNAQLEDRIESLIRQHGPATGQDGTKPTGRHKIMDSGAFEIDLATGEFLANNAASEMMNGSDGASAPTTITQCIELLHPEDRSRLIEALRRCQSDGELFKQEFRVPSGEGYCWLEAVGGIEAVDGKPARLLGFINDVSVRKAMELEKDQLYRELEQIITAVDQFAVTATLGLDGNIQATNELFCQFCGREEDELIGRSFSTLLMA